jgi:hypothetical protein
VTLARLAATTRGSPGARLSQPVERTPNAKPAAVQHLGARDNTLKGYQHERQY